MSCYYWPGEVNISSESHPVSALPSPPSSENFWEIPRFRLLELISEWGIWDPEHGSASSQRSWGRYPIRTPHLRSTTVFPSVCTPVVRWQSQLSGIIWHFRLRKFFSHLLFVSPQTHKINEKTPVNCCETRVREDRRFAQDTGAELRSPWFWIPCPSPSQHCSHFGMVEPSTDTIPPVGDARAHTTGRWELLGVYQVAFSERGWSLPEGKGGSHQQMTFPFCSELTLAIWWSRVLWCNWGRIFRP